MKILLLFTFSLLFLQLECQLVPVSEVKTHPTTEETKAKAREKIRSKLAKSQNSDEDSRPEAIPRPDDLMNFLLTQYEAAEEDDRVEILQNLEYFAHKYDNGLSLFQGTEVLGTILLPALNSSSASIRKGACGVFAAAAQNNKVVQNLSMEGGVVRRLVQLMTIEPDSMVRPRALSAIASLLRNFPEGQRLWIQDGGVSALVKVAFLPEMRKKCLVFITDLLAEREFCDEADFEGSDPIDPCDRMGQFLKSLEDSDYCNLLADSANRLQTLDEDDQILLIEAVKSSPCFKQLATFRSYFQQLIPTYERVAEVIKSLQEVIKRLEVAKDEL